MSQPTPPDEQSFVPARYEGLPGLIMIVAILLTIALAWGIVRLAPHRAAPEQPAIVAHRAVVEERGVRATITAGAVTVERVLPVASFALDESSSLDPRIAPGAFQVSMEVPLDARGVAARIGAVLRDGSVIIRHGDDVILSEAAEGSAREALSSQPLRLGRGERFTVEFRSRIVMGARPALRLVWRPEGSFATLPWPTATNSAVVPSEVRGLALAQERQCVQCHAVEDDAFAARLAAQPAPDLARAGARLRPGWLKLWLSDPTITKPGTAMPSMAHAEGLSEDQVEDLVHFIAAQGGPFVEDEVVDPGDAERIALRATGLVAYHEVGCFACHGPLEALEALPGGRGTSGPTWRRYRTLPSMALKTSVSALAAFLQDPHAARPDGAMPGMQLTDLEARAIATYLVDRDGAPPGRSFSLNPVRIRQGRKWFASAGCASCHELEGVEPELAGPPMASLDVAAGCLADDPTAGVPHFDLDDQQRSDLVAFVESARLRVSPSVPHDELVADLRRLGCVACHAWRTPAGTLGPESALARYFVSDEHADLGDEGRLPPDLTDAGARLTSAWMRSVLVDGDRARSYMKARMPDFGIDAVGHLPALLAAHDGGTEWEDREPPFSAEAAREGLDVVGAERLNCISCHAIAGESSTGMPGPDLALMPGRLRYGHFQRWLADPSRVRPGTRMPSFFAVTDGTPTINAVWAYLSQGESLPMPKGLRGADGVELMVGDTPIVLRTFMRASGVYAIACGYPQQVHCAFDAERGTVAAAWQGRFLSAAGAWSNRGGSETNPDATAWEGPSGLVFTLAGAETRVVFRGYALDDDGYPTFRTELRSGDAVVEMTERPEPITGARTGLRRRITLRGPAAAVIAIAPGAGVAVRGAEPAGDGAWSVTLDDDETTLELEVSW